MIIAKVLLSINQHKALARQALPAHLRTMLSRSLVGRSTTLSATVMVVMFTTMLAPLNSTIIAVALPQLMREFQVEVGQASWLVTGYLISMASLQPVAGALGDRWGRRRMILAGLLYFGLVSLAAALATNLWLLLFLRIQQALAAAVALPNGMALVREIAPARQRGRYTGWIGSAVAMAAAGGPPLGGLLVEWLGWRSIFSLNLFLVVPALIVGWRMLPEHRAGSGGRSFDFVGALLLLVSLSSAAWLLATQKQPSIWSSPLWPGGLSLVIVLGFLFLWWERRQRDPIVPLHFFRSSAFCAANGAIAASNLAMYVTFLALPLLLGEKAGWRATQTGLVLMAMSGMMALAAPLGGRLADQLGRRWPAVAGLGLLALGLLPLALTGGELKTLPLLAGLGLAGVGLGLSSAGLQTVALEAVPATAAGAAAGVFSTSRYLGSIGGAIALTLLLTTADSFAAVFVMTAAAAGLSALISLRLHDWA
jgi:EmrB/QacA subfamily drug resistance transporter